MSAQYSVFTLRTATLRVVVNDAHDKQNDVFYRVGRLHNVGARCDQCGELHFKVHTMIYKIIELFAILAYLVALIYIVLSGIKTDDNDGY